MYQDDSFAAGYAVGRDTANNNNSGFGWGNDSAWWIIILLIFGWGGNNGFGGFGGGFGNGGNMNFELGKLATTNDVASGFSTSEIMSDLNDIILGQAQGFAAVQQTLCQGFSGVNATVNQGFAGVNNAICTLGYQNQAGFNDLGRQISDCCCKLERGIDSVNYNSAKNTCDIIRAGQDNTRAILDFLTNEKIEGLRAENTSLKAQISNDRQTATLINEIKPCPIPAYITCNPYQSAYGFGFNNFGNYGNNGCGCGV